MAITIPLSLVTHLAILKRFNPPQQTLSYRGATDADNMDEVLPPSALVAAHCGTNEKPSSGLACILTELKITLVPLQQQSSSGRLVLAASGQTGIVGCPAVANHRPRVF